jgi:hypothetical protein
MKLWPLYVHSSCISKVQNAVTNFTAISSFKHIGLLIEKYVGITRREQQWKALYVLWTPKTHLISSL